MSHPLRILHTMTNFLLDHRGVDNPPVFPRVIPKAGHAMSRFIHTACHVVPRPLGQYPPLVPRIPARSTGFAV